MKNKETATKPSRVLNALRRLLRPNPIVVKDSRAQMRGARAFNMLTFYLLALGLMAYGLYRIVSFSMTSTYGASLGQSAAVGQELFVSLAFMEMLVVCFLTPALTAGVISGEYERSTYDLLATTPLHPSSLLRGKLIPALSYIMFLIMAAIPIFSIVFLFGGIVLKDMIQAIGLMILTAITFGMIATFFSALTRRTGRATVLSYLVVLTLVIGSVFGWAIAGVLQQQASASAWLYLNPLTALASATTTGTASYYYGGLSGIFSLFGGPDALGMYSVLPTRPIWQYTVALYGAITLVLYLLTTQLVKPVRRWRLNLRGWLSLALALLLIGGGLAVTFGTRWGSTLAPPQPVQFDQSSPIQSAFPVPIAPGAPGAVGIVVTIPPPPTPAPPPTAEPFDLEQESAAIERYLSDTFLLVGDVHPCDVEILLVDASEGFATVYLWAYCRSFTLKGDEVEAGIGTSVPVVVTMQWDYVSAWQILSYNAGAVASVLPPDVQEELRLAPYDEAAGEARLTEQARQLLLGTATP